MTPYLLTILGYWHHGGWCRDGSYTCHCPRRDQKNCADRDGKGKNGNVEFMRTILKNNFQPCDSRPQ